MMILYACIEKEDLDINECKERNYHMFLSTRIQNKTLVLESQGTAN